MDHAIGLIVPVAGQGTFPNVWKFLYSLPVTDKTEFFLIDTLGIYSGGIKGPIKKVIKRKGYIPVGALEIKMPNTFLKKIESKIKDTEILSKANDNLNSFIFELINSKAKWSDIPIYSDILSIFFRTKTMTKIWNKFFKKNITIKCIECSICKNVCPEKCFIDEEKHIDINSKDCILCQRCLEFCPVNAIQLNNKNYIKNNRYKYNEFRQYIL